MARRSKEVDRGQELFLARCVDGVVFVLSGYGSVVRELLVSGR